MKHRKTLNYTDDIKSDIQLCRLPIACCQSASPRGLFQGLTMKSALKIGTEIRARRMADVLFENNDVLYSDRAFTIYIRDGAAVENVVFRNNRVEVFGGLRDDRNRILDIEIDQRDEAIWQHPRWEEVKNNPGTLRNLLFEDTFVSTSESRYLEPSQITGYNRENSIENVTFRNFRINRKKITKPGESIPVGKTGNTIPWLEIDTETAQNIVFE